MMYVTIVHKNGQVYQMPVHQVSVHSADGQPCAISYERQGIIIHTNSTMNDFYSTVKELHIHPVELTEPKDG